jgi:hypothetical protein
LGVELGERPAVESSIHERAVVDAVSNLCEIFQNDDWVLDTLGVLDDLS